jgi:hypothetical protein
MKKMTKIIAGVAALATLSAGAFAFTACGGDGEQKLSGSAEIYGETHSYSAAVCYAGYAKIKVEDNKVTELSINEVTTPMDAKVTATSDVSLDDAKTKAIGTNGTVDDYVFVTSEATNNGVTTYSATGYYKQVNYANVKLTFDAEKATYLVNDTATTIVEYFRDDAKVQEYFEAVKNNNVSVQLNGAANKTVLTYKTLCKEENTYWHKEDKDGNDYSRWIANRDATVEYVKEYGIDKLFDLKQTVKVSEDKYGASDVTFWTDGTVTTGATWNDFSKTPTASAGYYSYAELIYKAYYRAVATKVYQGECSYYANYTDYGVKVEVAVDKDNKILNVAILPSNLTQASTYYTGNWSEETRTAYLNEEVSLLKKYVGKSVSDIKNATATIAGYQEAEENSVSISELKTGASQSSARLLLAVKDALKNA